MWCNTMSSNQRKCTHSPIVNNNSAETDNSKQAKSCGHCSHLEKMAEVEAVEGELRKKHASGSYTDEQLQGWAHLTQMNKHSSYDVPSTKPFGKHHRDQDNL